MDNKIESFFTNAALQMNELFQAGGTQAVTTAAPANANATTSLLAANDSVDHSVAEDGSGVLLDIYRPFDTSNPQLNDQLLLARTGAPSAVAPVQTKSGPPTMTASAQFNSGDHNCFELKFDRPVSRAEAEKVLFKGDKTPAPRLRVYETHPHDQRVLLGSHSYDKDGKSAQWVLSLPKLPTTVVEDLKPGVDAVLLDAPGKLPDWVPAATRQVMESGEIPKPGDPRFATVRTVFEDEKNEYGETSKQTKKIEVDQDGQPLTSNLVTSWRDGDVTVRYDARTGELGMFHDQPGAEMGGYNRSMQMKMLVNGRSVDRAAYETFKDFALYMADGVLTASMHTRA